MKHKPLPPIEKVARSLVVIALLEAIENVAASVECDDDSGAIAEPMDINAVEHDAYIWLDDWGHEYADTEFEMLGVDWDEDMCAKAVDLASDYVEARIKDMPKELSTWQAARWHEYLENAPVY